MFSVIASAGHAGRVTITKWNPRHSDHCYCVNRLPKIKRSAIKTFMQEDFFTMPGITSKQVTSLMKVKHQYDVHPRTAQRAVRDLRMANEEEIRSSFQRLESLLRKFAESNPGTEFYYDNDGDFRFYECALFPPLDAVLDHCIPVISVDGSHIRTEFVGVVLTVCVMDGNHNIVPIGIGIVDGENANSWGRFMGALARAHPRLQSPDAANVWTMIHDRQKGLIKAHDDHLPFVNRAHCVEHLKANLVGNGHKEIANLVYSVAKALTEETYRFALERCRKADDISQEGYDYLMKSMPEHWATIPFPISRFGVVTSNNSECFNSSILELRARTHLYIIDSWIENLAILASLRKTQYIEEQRKSEKLSAWVQKQVDDNLTVARSYSVTITDLETMSGCVHDPVRRNVCVHPERPSCSCGFYEEFRFPCAHMFALARVLRHQGLPSNLYISIHPVYFVEHLVQLYQSNIACVDVETLMADPRVLPPPKVPTRPGPLAIKRRSKGDRRMTAKRVPPPATQTFISEPAEPSGTSTDGWRVPANVPTDAVHKELTAFSTPDAILTSAASHPPGATQDDPPQSSMTQSPKQPKAKRSRQVTACPHCGWSHYFGVSMCPTPNKPSEEDAVAQAQRIKVTPTPINCSQCRWTHDSQRTPCRHPPKKDTPAQEGLN